MVACLIANRGEQRTFRRSRVVDAWLIADWSVQKTLRRSHGEVAGSLVTHCGLMTSLSGWSDPDPTRRLDRIGVIPLSCLVIACVTIETTPIPWWAQPFSYKYSNFRREKVRIGDVGRSWSKIVTERGRSWSKIVTERGRRAIEETRRAGKEKIVQLTQGELQRMMEEASRNAILAYERRTQPLENETARRKIVRERETERAYEGMSRRAPERRRAVAPSEVGSSSQIGWRRREPAISRADVDSVGRQIHLLGKQIDELKRRGELVTQNKNSPFCNNILSEVVNAAFKMPDLPKYDGLKDPQEHVSAFDLVMNLYGQSDSIEAKLFVTTLTGKMQEWFTSLPARSIKSHEQLVQKFVFHFASKRKQKRSATYLFTIRQRDNETLKNFMGRFNNET
ncbi:UNVERIFIED_CONTAM: hypothetical protein Sindi_2451600 [Sesamum indicum]